VTAIRRFTSVSCEGTRTTQTGKPSFQR
jgi:hypothetical protein